MGTRDSEPNEAGEVGAELQRWVGREQTLHEMVTPRPVQGMLALLDRDPTAIGQGDPLPWGWHWLFGNPTPRSSELAADGHEEKGRFLPPVPLPRRMWAGGRIRFAQPLRVGEEAEFRSRVHEIQEKSGRSGPLTFVTVRIEVTGPRGTALDEERTLVYRDPEFGESGKDSPPRSSSVPSGPTPPPDPLWSEPFQAGPVDLFRFSALTFNGHRIHFDHPYATEVEGYPDLVVHGPLLALLLLESGVRRLGRAPTTFTYRGRSPVFSGEEVRVEGRGNPDAGEEQTLELWVAHPDRGVAMEATLR